MRHGIEHELIIMPGRGHIFDIDGEGMRDLAVAELFDRVLALLEKQECSS